MEAFDTTLQIIIRQGSKPLHVTVDPGASASTFSLSYFHKLFPEYFTKTGTLRKTTLKPTATNWTAHDGTP